MAARRSPETRIAPLPKDAPRARPSVRAWMNAARAHLDDGRVVTCIPHQGLSVVIDAERIASPVARAQANRAALPVEEFLRRWTLLEVGLKVRDALPSALLRGSRQLLAGRTPLIPRGWSVRTLLVGDVIVSVAWRTRSRRGAQRGRSTPPPVVDISY